MYENITMKPIVLYALYANLKLIKIDFNKNVCRQTIIPKHEVWIICLHPLGCKLRQVTAFVQIKYGLISGNYIIKYEARD